MTNGSFTLKTIRVIVETEGSGQVLDVQSLPVSVKVAKTGGETNSSAEITIYNLALDKVQQLTALTFKNLMRPSTTVKVYAGEKGASLYLVYEGDVIRAVPKFDTRGNLSITFGCIVGYFDGRGYTTSASVKEGEVPLGSLLNQLAPKNLAVELADAVKGIKVTAGTAVVGDFTAVLKWLSRSYGVTSIREGNVIRVTPVSPDATDVYVLSRETGLLGYPSFTGTGVTCKAIFNPNFKVQTFFRIDSLLPGTDGIWQATKVEYSLEANTPKGGDWTMVVTACFKETDSSSDAFGPEGDNATASEDEGATGAASGSGSSSGESGDTDASGDAEAGLTQQEAAGWARDFETAVKNGDTNGYTYENIQEGEAGLNDTQISSVLNELNKGIVTAEKLQGLGYPDKLITGAGYKL